MLVRLCTLVLLGIPFGLGTLACGGATVPQPASPGQSAGASRVAVVDVERVLEETPQGQAARAQLEAARDGAQTRIDEIEDEIRRAGQEVAELKSGDADAETVAAREMELAAMQEQAARAAAGLQQQLEAGRAQLLAPLMDELSYAAGKVAEREGYDLVLNRSSTPHYLEAVDLTTAVVEALRDEATALEPL